MLESTVKSYLFIQGSPGIEAGGYEINKSISYDNKKYMINFQQDLMGTGW